MWHPEDESLKMLVELLNESQVPDNNKQREIHNKITELSNNPEFANYLVYILAIADNPNVNILRRIAGATLKGVLDRKYDQIPSQNLEFVKLKLMEAFNDPASMIRSTVTNAMTVLLTKIGFQNWPELMKFLILNLTVDHQEFVESSLECTYKILEDIKVGADSFNYQDEKYQAFIGELIPKLLFLCEPKLPPKIKALAISSLNLFVYSMPQVLYNNFGVYYDMLMVSSHDQVPEVRMRACEGFLEIAETKKNLLIPNLQKIIERMIQMTADSESTIKRVVCRFWNEYLNLLEGETYERIEALREYLVILIPLLINCLHYTEEDMLNDNEDKHEVKIRGHKNFYNEYGGDLENGRQTEDSADKENNQGTWTLRREAGKVLENLAKRYNDEIFIRAQEKIAESLRSSDWHIKEAGILCLGALAEGAQNAILAHFKDLFPFLMSSVDDQFPLVRSVSMWTLSRFTAWILEQGKIDQSIIQAYLTKVLQKMMDENGKVQEASCSALSQVAYANAALIEQYLYDIIEVIKHVYEHYKKKSLTNLYDVIAAISSNIPKEKFQDPHIQNTILNILMRKWNESNFNDRESIYLVECTDSIIGMMGKQSLNHAEFFVTRLLFLIFNYIQARKSDDQKYLYHKKEIAVRAFDLLGTFLANIGAHMEKIIKHHDDYFNIYLECVQDQDLAIRKVALASAGEVAKYSPTILRGKGERIIQFYNENLFVVPPDQDAGQMYNGTCNNCAWAIGELALAYPNELMNYIPQFVHKITAILIDETMKKAPPLDQNLAITLGRLGLVHPDAVAELLEQFLKLFCVSLDRIQGDPEKQQAFRGLFLAISKNPNGIVKDFVSLCEALVNFENAEIDLQELASKLVINFKAVAGHLWDSYFENFPKELQDKMKQRFAI